MLWQSREFCRRSRFSEDRGFEMRPVRMHARRVAYATQRVASHQIRIRKPLGIPLRRILHRFRLQFLLLRLSFGWRYKVAQHVTQRIADRRDFAWSRERRRHRCELLQVSRLVLFLHWKSKRLAWPSCRSCDQHVSMLELASSFLCFFTYRLNQKRYLRPVSTTNVEKSILCFFYWSSIKASG